MLKNIKVTNFCSIGETQEMSFEVTSKDILNDSAKKISLTDKAKSSVSLNLVSCLIGANASGKTTMIKAITFLFRLISDSYGSSNAKIPPIAHKLRENQSTKIEISFLDGGSLYWYSIELNKKEILHEYLGKRVERETCVFELSRKDGKTEIKAPKIKINETDKQRFMERSNVPLLSSLISTKYITDISFFEKFISNVTHFGMSYAPSFSNFLTSSEILRNDEALLGEVLKISQKVDLGISKFGFREVVFQSGSDLKDEDKKWFLQCIHASDKKSFTLDLLYESNGTQHFIYILSKILPILRTGGVVVLDEIETGLHPHIVKKLIELFEDKKINHSNAQIIFSTHQHPLIADRTKTQIFLAEKDDKNFETEIYRLDEVNGVRNDENYYQKYIAGAYGATPKINWL